MKIKKKGITLIELVIAMAILGIVMATVTIAFTSNSNILSKVDMKSELQLDAQMIQEQLSTIALECSGVVANESNQLILQDSLIENNIHLFELTEKSLGYKMIEIGSDEETTILKEKVLSNYVNGMSVEVNGRIIKYQIELIMKSGKNTESLTIENQIVFRNSK